MFDWKSSFQVLSFKISSLRQHLLKNSNIIYPNFKKLLLYKLYLIIILCIYKDFYHWEKPYLNSWKILIIYMCLRSPISCWHVTRFISRHSLGAMNELRLCQKYFDMAPRDTLANNDEKLSGERFLSFTDDDVEKFLGVEENKNTRRTKTDSDDPRSFNYLISLFTLIDYNWHQQQKSFI